jgi:hypothetical protein
VNAEAMVIAAGQNIKRLLTFSGRGPRKLAQAQALRPPAPAPSANSRLLQGSHRRRSTPLLARFSTGWGVLRSSPGKLKENLHWKVVPVLAMLLQ